MRIYKPFKITGTRGRWRLALLAALLAALGVLAGTAGVGPAGAATSTGQQSNGSQCSASYLQSGLHLANVTVDSASLDTTGSFTSEGQTITGLPAFCDVALTQTDSAGNPIHIEVWLPESTWNGRFQGVGGAVFECGPMYSETAAAIQDGYSSATTDCGVNPADLLTGDWALNSNGTQNTALIDDFSYQGIHDMSVAGQAVTKLYYTSPLKYSYFNGCSTGGREGLMEAQKFPADYNGIVSGSPAINWTQFIPSELWPELVMLQSNDFLPSCIQTAFTNAVIAQCADGSGVIENPSACHFNPFTLVGEVTPCGTITKTDAAVMEKIWDGPVVDGKHLWYGLEPGASTLNLAATITSNGTTSAEPFPIPVGWLQYWVTQNPGLNWQTITYQQFAQYFEQSISEFGVIATNNPNLSAFERDGGKILIWHGLADQLIFPQGTIQYYQRVQDTLGVKNTATFARLFIAPGAQHCAAAAGPAPANPLQDVVNWVEHGQAPATILATGGVDPSTNQATQRPLCAYPYLSEYVGGNPDSLSSYACKLLTPGQQRQLTALK